jgi:magnesium chelatase accessory protein
MDRAPTGLPDSDWPHAAASRRVDAGGLRWHVQRWGDGPRRLLLLHGTGASAHTWRVLAPAWADQGWQVLAPDLPGHGHSAALTRGRRTMAGMGDALATLLAHEDFQPQAVVGHSAGAALMLRLAVDGRLPAPTLVGLNAALLPFEGLAGLLYAPLARLLAAGPGIAQLTAWRARDVAGVRRLVASCGSTLDDAGVALYARLLQRPSHVAGALAMMANWDLHTLRRDLPRLDRPLHLLVTDRDTAVPPAQAQRLAAGWPGVHLHRLSGLGHLAHEEAPARVMALVNPLLAAA